MFDTMGEYEAQQALDLACHFITHTDVEYQAGTVRWAGEVPPERIDGKFDYKICPNQDYTGMTVQDYNEADYVVVEE